LDGNYLAAIDPINNAFVVKKNKIPYGNLPKGSVEYSTDGSQVYFEQQALIVMPTTSTPYGLYQVNLLSPQQSNLMMIRITALPWSTISRMATSGEEATHFCPQYSRWMIFYLFIPMPQHTTRARGR
jgi:hypothetical protein